jgi:hypothetical protein
MKRARPNVTRDIPCIPGSARVSRAGFGVAPKQSSFGGLPSAEAKILEKVREAETASPTRETRALPNWGHFRHFLVIRH